MARKQRDAGDRPEELKVFISHRASVCGECHEELGRQEAVRLAIVAHARHAETDYDERLAHGEERLDARALDTRTRGS